METAIDPLGQEEHYQYNARGELLRKTDREGYVTKYGYTKHGNLSCILHGNGRAAFGESVPKRNTHRIYIRQEGPRHRAHLHGRRRDYRPVCVRVRPGREQDRAPEVEEGLGEKGGQYAYRYDALGRLSEARKDGRLLRRYRYDAFGRDLYGNQGEAQAFGYTGYQYDNVSGTYFAQAREYEPGVGRFAGMDVIGGFVDVPVTLNRYGYCLQNPVRLVDLNGKTPIEGCTGECDEKGIPHSQYHECSRVNNQVFFYNDIFSKSISVNRKGIKGRWNMETQGWEDDHGKLQWNTETRVANVSVDIAYDGGISGSLLEQDISFRTIRTKNKEIHLGATGGLFSIGAGSGTDIDVTNKGIKISFGKASKVFADMAFWIRIDNVEMCDK